MRFVARTDDGAVVDERIYILRRRRLRGGRRRSGAARAGGAGHAASPAVRECRGAAGAVRAPRPGDQRRDTAERVRGAAGSRGARGPAGDLEGDAAVRPARLRNGRRAAGTARAAPRGATLPPVGGPARGVAARPADHHGLGEPLCPGRERGERGGRPGRHRPDQWGRRNRPGRAALLRPLLPRRGRRRRGPLPADRRRDRPAVQGQRLDQRRRGRLPGRGGLSLLDGGGRP